MQHRTFSLLSVVLVLGLLPVLGAGATSAPSHGTLSFVEVEYGDVGTYQANAVAVSPDGAHVYLAAPGTLSAFRRDPTSDALAFVDMEQDGVDGVDGMWGPGGLAVSPDGEHVYAASYFDNALVAFDRNPTSGALTFVEMEQDGVAGVDGLAGAENVALSPDGKHVYVAASDDNALAVFSRNAASGALTFLDAVWDTDAGVGGLDGAYSAAVSPDGKHVYVAANDEGALSVFSRDATSGALTFVEVERDGVSGVDGLSGARAVALSPDGAHVYVAAYYDDALAVFSRNATSGALTFVGALKDSDPGLEGLDRAASVSVSPDGAHVYAAAYGDDGVAAFSRNAASGALTFVGAVLDGEPGVYALGGAKSVALSPDGVHVYAAAWNAGAVAVFSRNAASGALTFRDARQDAGGLRGPVGLAVSPDGAHVYATGNDSDSLVVFRRAAADGKLAYVEVLRDTTCYGLTGARAAVVSPDGAHVYVAGHDDNAVAMFRRDAASGALSYLGQKLDGASGVVGLGGVQALTLSPDGVHLYAAAEGDDALAIFERDASSGTLTFLDAVWDTDAGVDGLDGAYSVAVSPDGKHLYAASYIDNAVAVFSRNATSGALSFVEVERDGVSGVDGLSGANSVAVSPDGAHVYVASRGDSAVAVFSRNATSGALSFVDALFETDPGVDGLWGARALVVNPNGGYVYVAGQFDDALACLSRDPVSGALAFVDVIRDIDPGVDGLATANGLAISPSGGHLYVTGYDDDALAVVAHHFDLALPLIIRD
jgi:6-phosphogluconolactonase (cycloisomerase 2 family)